MSEDTQPRIADRKLWERVLYMLFCAIAYSVAEFVVAVVAIFQIVCVALTGSINERVQQLGRNVGTYIFELLQFATFNDERVPFPFSDWPDETPGESPWRRDAARTAAEPAPPAPPPAHEPAPAPAAAEPPAAEPPAASGAGTPADAAGSAASTSEAADGTDPDAPSR